MEKISFDEAIAWAHQCAQNYSLHTQWEEKMKLQGYLALLSGDFHAYAKNWQRMQRAGIVNHADLQEDEKLSLALDSIPMPSLLSIPPENSNSIEIVEEAAKRGSAAASNVVMAHVDWLPEFAYSKMSVIDRLLIEGGDACYTYAKEVTDKNVAETLMGICYWEGWGVMEDKELSLKYFLNVVDKSAWGQYYMSRFYREGYILEKDIRKADRWERIAAHSGCWQAVKNIVRKKKGHNENIWHDLAGWFAQKSDAKAMCLFAKLLFKQGGTERCIWLLREAANKGNSDALYQLALCYYKGQGVCKDEQEALKWYQRAAEQGHLKAQAALGFRYDKGSGVEINQEQAFLWHRKAAEQGLPIAQFNLGKCYEYGKGITENAEAAYRWYRKAAEQGLSVAQFELAQCYGRGVGVDKNKGKAVQGAQRAAEQGYAKAQRLLGDHYYYGEGVSENKVEAFRWYSKAAEQEDATAEYMLGDCYYRGYGTEENEQEALKWYLKAAEHGDAIAQLTLGDCYHNGIIVELNKAESIDWYRKAAEQNECEAQYKLGCCYAQGDGVEKSHSRAFELFRRSAEQGHDKAQYELGCCYKDGKGVKKDMQEALIWLRKAEKNGNTEAGIDLLGLELFFGNCAKSV